MGKVRQENLSVEALKADVKKKSRGGQKSKEKKDYSLRAVFRQALSELDIEKLKKPWMAAKSFQLVDTEEALARWVDSVLDDESIWLRPYHDRPERMPVVAVDTETYGLDTRIIVDYEYITDPDTGGQARVPVYELNIEIAGVCLSADGIKGLYVPIFHEDGRNVPIEAVTRHLQRLFDRSHLVFYNAKFDREVMRQTLGIGFRPYPYFEDVQVLHYIDDPKAKLDDDSFRGGSEGLKKLSASALQMSMIELGSIAKVRAEVERTFEEMEALRLRPNWTRLKKKDPHVCRCGVKAAWLRIQTVRREYGGEEIVEEAQCAEHTDRVRYQPVSKKVQHVPFMWVPTRVAVWYAASDAICTWLLWRKLHLCAQQRVRPHRIDGELIDTITWVERQRWLIDTTRHERLKRWAKKSGEERLAKLEHLAIKHGWEVSTDDDGDVIEGTEFKVNSPIDLPKLLFDIKGYKVTKHTPKGKRSCDADALIDLLKAHPNDEFLLALSDYREYVALHPEKLAWDKRDNTARIHLKQAVTAGGRLAAAGGEFAKDGGMQVNPQAVKSVGGNWWVSGDILSPDDDQIDPEGVAEYSLHDLHPSCFKAVKDDEVKTNDGKALTRDNPAYDEVAERLGFVRIDGKWKRKAPGILKNHIGLYLGYAICLVPGCKTCTSNYGVLIPKTRLDCNQIINFRQLFVGEPGWTVVCTDYSNVEVRGAANVSGEPELQKIFLEGDGDHHALTASKVFPEFNDPRISKARRKELRSCAKIINFALQYGGTFYTIYENLKELIPDITQQRTRAMVDAYWKGVPQFARWCEDKRREAREHMICTTAMDRIIRFDSAMAALGIEKPTDEQEKLCKRYYGIRKEWRVLTQRLDDDRKRPNGDQMPPQDREMLASEAKVLKNHMDGLWQDEDSGVRNALDYHQFMSKIERVAMNAPIQGLAGDIMRMALNRIRKWATVTDPLVQFVFRLHNTVHDEINHTTKNPYLPYVVPRITRMMKLRSLHAKLAWPVGLEADTEYGTTWDIEHHLTGDADHVPAGWTQVRGMEEYLPEGVAMATVERMTEALLSGDDAVRARVHTWFRKKLHVRAAQAGWHAIWYLDKDKMQQPQVDGKTIRRQIIAAFQLDEFWEIDNIPDGRDDLLETFEHFEARCGLTAADRGFAPEGGWLFTPPRDRVRRKAVPILGPEPEPVPEPVVPRKEEAQMSLEYQLETSPAIPTPEPVAPEPREEAVVVERPGALVEPAPPAPSAEDEMFYEKPKRRTEPVSVASPPVVPRPPAPQTSRHPVLRDELTRPDLQAMVKTMGKGFGSQSVQVYYRAELLTISKVVSVTIPAEYLKGYPNA